MQMKIQLISLVSTILLILNSCQLPLSESQLDLLDIAEPGDSLIFCCDSINCDTLIISQKDIYNEKDA